MEKKRNIKLAVRTGTPKKKSNKRARSARAGQTDQAKSKAAKSENESSLQRTVTPPTEEIDNVMSILEDMDIETVEVSGEDKSPGPVETTHKAPAKKEEETN